VSEIVSPEDSSLPVDSATSAPSGSEAIDWTAIENDASFQELVAKKRNFIVPATIVFLVYYFGFLIFVGYFPEAAEVNVIGQINLAYLIAISEFVMAWIIVYLYARQAGLFDKMTASILSRIKGGKL